jgi:hypothetical protein
MPKKVLAILLFLVIFGLSCAISLPDPDSNPLVSCNSFLSCPGAKTVHGVPAGITPYDSNGHSHFSAYGIVFDAFCSFIVSLVVSEFLPETKFKKERRENSRH